MDHNINISKFTDWLNANWKGSKNCPICQENKWNMGDIFEIRRFSGGNLTVGGPVNPVIPLTCLVCGNTLFFNAMITGALEGKKEDKSTNSESSKTDTETQKKDGRSENVS